MSQVATDFGLPDVSVAVGALVGYPVGGTLRMAHDAGAAGAELLLTPAILRRGPQHYAALSHHWQLPITSVHARLLFGNQSLDDTIASDIASLQFAAALPGCGVLVVHHPIVKPGREDELRAWATAMHDALTASRSPLTVAVENRPHNRDSVPAQWLDDPCNLFAFVEKCGFHATLDLAHAASHDLPLVPTLETLLPRLANVHWCDQRPSRLRGGIPCGLWRDHQLPGEGMLPLDNVAATLRAHAYSGLVTLELSPWSLRQWWPALAARRMRDAVCRSQRILRTRD